MDQPHSTKRILKAVYLILFISFITGLIFSFRAVSSISTGMLLFTGLITNRSFFSSLFRQKKILFFLGAAWLFTLLQIVSLFYTKNQEEGLSNIIMSGSVFLSPLAICCTGYLDNNTTKKILQIFCILLVIASMYCLVNAFIHYNRSGDITFFFYQELVQPLQHHAVYFSILVFTAIVFCGESARYSEKGKAGWYFAGLVYFPVVLLLLSSKLVIIFFVLYFFYFSISTIRKQKGRVKAWFPLIIVVVSAACLALFTKNPVSERFADLLRGEINKFNKEQYTPADYFNGLQFRLLHWKLVPEILDENRSWITGVSPGDAQGELNKKYRARKMYEGDPQHNDPGYLLYNTHNQFLQSLLENGIIGLLVFAFLFFSVIKLAWHNRKPKGMSFAIMLLLAFTFTESILKTQYGIILFTFLPLLLYYYEKEDKSS